MPDNLFVYGTLHPERAPAEIAAVVRRLRPIGPGTIRARLHHFRDYPAVKLDGKNGSRVRGEVFQLPDEAELDQLDAYEEYYPFALEKSLFQRKRVRVRLKSGTMMDCWVYEYNGSLPSEIAGRKLKTRLAVRSPSGAHS